MIFVVLSLSMTRLTSIVGGEMWLICFALSLRENGVDDGKLHLIIDEIITSFLTVICAAHNYCCYQNCHYGQY